MTNLLMKFVGFAALEAVFIAGFTDLRIFYIGIYNIILMSVDTIERLKSDF